MFWRTHVAPSDAHAAIRLGDWKLVADKSLEKFKLFQIEKDWKEENDLAAEMPEKVAEMKKEFFATWKAIEAEGPRDWWENEPARKKKPKKKKK